MRASEETLFLAWRGNLLVHSEKQKILLQISARMRGLPEKLNKYNTSISHLSSSNE